MPGRHAMQIVAIPLRIRYSEGQGYVLTVKIVEGPQSLLDRKIAVRMTFKQLEAIENWEVALDEGEEVSRLELENLKGG
jgi:hypothetical protein